MATPPEYTDDDDRDSALGSASTYATSLTSVPSTLYRHIEEHGRTFNAYKTGKYAMPNDEREQDRNDFHHAIHMEVYNGRLAMAPIDDMPLHNVLDIGTGTGVWAIEFADKCPSAHVIGTDLSPIQPTAVPVNCTFEIDDAEDEWIFGHKFEYIHARNLAASLRNTSAVIQSAADSLNPGGYLEFQDTILPPEYAEPPPADSAFVKYMAIVLEVAEKIGTPWTNASRHAEWMRDAGLVEVAEHRTTLAIGTWPSNERDKKLGAWSLSNWLDAADAVVPLLLTQTDWQKDEIAVLIAQVRNELRSGAVKPYTILLAVWGKQPL